MCEIFIFFNLTFIIQINEKCFLFIFNDVLYLVTFQLIDQ